jgi:hypothetical protein
MVVGHLVFNADPGDLKTSKLRPLRRLVETF